MADVLRTSIVPILNAIKAELVANAVHTADHIFFVAREPNDIPKTMGDSFLALRPRGPVPTRNIGGGRTDRRVRRRLSVYVFDRLALDEVDRDYAWLTDPTHGLLPLEEAVVNILDTFQPVDGAGNLLCYEPLLWVPSSEPRKDRLDPAWGESILEFEVPYLIALDQARQ